MEQQPGYVRAVDTADFPTGVIQRSHEVPVVVDFWAEWCGPCRVLGPLLEKAAAEYGGRFELAKVDVDRNQALSAQFGVQGIPNVIAFRDGVPVSRFTGAIPEAQLHEWLRSFLPTELDELVDAARDAALASDPEGAEQLFRQVLEHTPDHGEAGTGLAALLLARNEPQAALDILARLPATDEVARLQAAARLSAVDDNDVPALEARLEADPDNERLRMDLARSLAGRGEYEPALDHMLALVRSKGELADEARLGMLDIFGVLGSDHPLSLVYRRQLASALF